MRTRPNSDSGFTLIELVMIIIVLAVGLLGVLKALNYATSHSTDPMIQIRSIELGQRYLDEILPMRFNENTPDSGIPACSAGGIPCAAIGTDGEARANFDDVDDFNGLVETPAGYPGYTVSVAVVDASGDNIGVANPGAPHILRIDVTVNDPLNSQMTFSAYRMNF